jgi:glycosyltransferase involved in cell wall biosynthesis
MRILYISSYYPLPATNGATMRLWAVLRTIAQAGHELTLVSFRDPKESAATEDQLLEVCSDFETVPLQLTRMADAGYLSRLMAVFSPSPILFDRYRSKKMRNCLERHLRDGNYDVVICDNVPASVNLPDDTAIPVLINTCDVASSLISRYADHEPNLLKKLYARIEGAKVRRMEARIFGRAHLSMACCADDANILKSLRPGLRVLLIPNVVDVSGYEAGAKEAPDTLIFVGSMDSIANRDGLQYFVREIFPLIQKEVPTVRLVAAGRNPSSQFRAQFADVRALEFTGTLSDIRPVIASAAVSVIPLRIGSGTRLKILEGAAMGKAMVSTTLGAEGLEFEAGKEIVIADRPQDFSQQVVALLRDPDQRKRLGEAARRRVVADYDLSALRQSVAAVLNSVSGADKQGSELALQSAREPSLKGEVRRI